MVIIDKCAQKETNRKITKLFIECATKHDQFNIKYKHNNNIFIFNFKIGSFKPQFDQLIELSIYVLLFDSLYKWLNFRINMVLTTHLNPYISTLFGYIIPP